jgi:hypothetical protein
MELFIAQSSKLEDIQKAFHKVFPFLNIAFFTGQVKRDLPDVQMLESSTNTRVQDIRHSEKEGILQLSGNMSVETLEETFHRDFDLHVQVLRRSGEKWLVTTSTNDLSLQQQNTMGSLSVRKQKQDWKAQDYNLSDRD